MVPADDLVVGETLLHYAVHVRPRSVSECERPHVASGRDRAHDECELEAQTDRGEGGGDDGRGSDDAWDGEADDRTEHRPKLGPVDRVRGGEDQPGHEDAEDERRGHREADGREQRGAGEPDEDQHDRFGEPDSSRDGGDGGRGGKERDGRKLSRRGTPRPGDRSGARPAYAIPHGEGRIGSA